MIKQSFQHATDPQQKIPKHPLVLILLLLGELLKTRFLVALRHTVPVGTASDNRIW